jgi:predicted  nucleic acid-binding Zn-ribbon protein
LELLIHDLQAKHAALEDQYQLALDMTNELNEKLIKRGETITRLQQQVGKLNDTLERAHQDIRDQTAIQEHKESEIQDLKTQLIDNPVDVTTSSFATEVTIAELRKNLETLKTQLVRI